MSSSLLTASNEKVNGEGAKGTLAAPLPMEATAPGGGATIRRGVATIVDRIE
jgi:hypothetical protein